MGPGIVYYVGINPSVPYGLNVGIEHAGGYRSRYAHLDEIQVVVGQPVTAGQQIGLSGNTGNSSGPHLHIALKRDGVTYIDKLGQPWPSNLIDPWDLLKHLYNPPGKVKMSGWVYDYLVEGSDGEGVSISTNLNMRSGPGTTHPIIGQVAVTTVCEITGEKQNGYYPVNSWVTESPTPVYQYNGPAVTLSPALHSPGSDWEWGNTAVQNLYNSLNIPVKWQSNGVSSNYWPAFNKPKFDMVRVFWKPPYHKTPEQAWNEDIRDGVLSFYTKGARKFEVLNEPNLPDEGAYIVWDESTFGDWLLGLCQIIKANCPEAKLYFPGMSPGVPWTNQFVWINKAWPVVKPVMSGFCLHAYTGTVDNQATAVNDIVYQVTEAQKYLNLQVPLVVSEASVNRAADAAYKAAVYKAVENDLKFTPGIEAVVWYVSSWEQAKPEDKANQESWVEFGIGAAYKLL